MAPQNRMMPRGAVVSWCGVWGFLKGLSGPCDQRLTRVSGDWGSAAGLIVRQMERSIFSFSKSCLSHTHTHPLIPQRPPPVGALTLQGSSFLCKDKTQELFRTHNRWKHTLVFYNSSKQHKTGKKISIWLKACDCGDNQQDRRRTTVTLCDPTMEYIRGVNACNFFFFFFFKCEGDLCKTQIHTEYWGVSTLEPAAFKRFHH